MSRDDVYDAAIGYTNMRWSVIPIRPKTKKPTIPWSEYQKRLPTGEELEQWFLENDWDIGIVTGEISNLAVVDVDTEEGMQEVKRLKLPLSGPAVKTAKGYHAYFTYHAGLKNAVRNIPGCDCRADGGYVVAPPSINGTGQPYTWHRHYERPLPPLPEEYFSQIKEVEKEYGKNITVSFEEGNRDESLFHTALVLQSSRTMRPDNVDAVLNQLAKSCGYPLSDVKTKIISASRRETERSLKTDITQWVQEQSGTWTIDQLDRELNIPPANKSNRRTILSRLGKDGVIEKAGRKAGVWRKIEHELIPIRYQEEVTDKPYDIQWPVGFGIEDLCELYPKNIAIVAGAPNAGKTALLLNIIHLNQHKYKIVYYSSEMSHMELRSRLEKFDCDISDWNFRAYERIHNFADVIPPNDHVILIDYLEILSDFYQVGTIIQSIYERLNTSIAIIAIQKKRGASLGRGSEFSLERPRLYLSIDEGYLTIQKSKGWKTQVNPNGMTWDFDILGGCKFANVQLREEE